MGTRIATNIDTGTFYSIIEFLKKKNWKLIVEYDETNFDKGIDFDFYQFTQNNEQIFLAWSNWFEGEIKTTTNTLNMIVEQFEISFQFGEAEYLQRMDILEHLKPLLKFKE